MYWIIFLLSGALFDMCVYNGFVLHEPDNTSDHDPMVMRLSLDVRYTGWPSGQLTFLFVKFEWIDKIQ